MHDGVGQLLQGGDQSSSVVWDVLDRLGSVVAQVGDTATAQGTKTTLAQQNASASAGVDRSSQFTQVASCSDWGAPQFATNGWTSTTGFSGEQSDPASGSSLFYSRGYDTATGSWLSADSYRGSAGSPLSMNRYAYVMGDPVSSRDQLGFWSLGSLFSSAVKAVTSTISHVAKAAVSFGVKVAANVKPWLNKAKSFASNAVAGIRAGVNKFVRNARNTINGIVSSARHMSDQFMADMHDRIEDVQNWAAGDGGQMASQILGNISAVSGVAAGVLAMTGVGAPVAAVLGAISVGTGVAGAAVDCVGGRSVDCVAGLATSFIPGGKVAKAAVELATGLGKAVVKAVPRVIKAVAGAAQAVGRAVAAGVTAASKAIADGARAAADAARKYIAPRISALRASGDAGETTIFSGRSSGGALERVADFRSTPLAWNHYIKHVLGSGKKDGLPDMPEFLSFADYRAAARSFMGGGKAPGVLEGVRPSDGALVRFDPSNGHFGVRSDGVIKTFFRPDKGIGEVWK